MSSSIDAQKHEYQKGDLAQIINEKHPWFPAVFTVTRVSFFEVEGDIFVFDETCPHNNVAHGKFRRIDIEPVGRAVFVKKNTKPEPVGLYQGLPQGKF